MNYFYIIIISIFISFSFTQENNKIINNKLITRTIIDSETKEELTGVKITTENNIFYSDFNGKIKLPQHIKQFKIELISYQDTTIISTDRIIKINRL